MIAKIKLINGVGHISHILKTHINWNLVVIANHKANALQPQVGMTVIIPHGKKSFRFYITHIVADLRRPGYHETHGSVVLVERRGFDITVDDDNRMHKLARQLKRWGWKEEAI